jgi:hypothetical protein
MLAPASHLPKEQAGLYQILGLVDRRRNCPVAPEEVEPEPTPCDLPNDRDLEYVRLHQLPVWIGRWACPAGPDHSANRLLASRTRPASAQMASAWCRMEIPVAVHDWEHLKRLAGGKRPKYSWFHHPRWCVHSQRSFGSQMRKNADS